MSWSIGAKGTKEEVKRALTAQAEAPLQIYAGTSEGEDVKTALASALRLVDDTVLGEKNYDGKIYNAVQVSAYGSHSTSSGGQIAGSFSVSVNAIVDG